MTHRVLAPQPGLLVLSAGLVTAVLVAACGAGSPGPTAGTPAPASKPGAGPAAAAPGPAAAAAPGANSPWCTAVGQVYQTHQKLMLHAYNRDDVSELKRQSREAADRLRQMAPADL